MPKKLKVMLSSRCVPKIPYGDTDVTLTVIRQEIKRQLEAITLLGQPLFDVWMNEEAPSGEPLNSWWTECLKQVRKSDITLVLYNGQAGGTMDGGSIGICHAELLEALKGGTGKVRIMQLPLLPPEKPEEAERDKRFQAYASQLNMFAARPKTGEAVIEQVKLTLFDMMHELLHAGARSVRGGRFDAGEALDWNKLSFQERKKKLEEAMCTALERRNAGQGPDGSLVLTIANHKILAFCHGVPAALSVSSAKEMVGQPFLNDHAYAPELQGDTWGPLHFIACHRGVTETQATKLLGFQDAMVVSSHFGIYVVDNILKTQLVFLPNCRDAATLANNVEHFFDWLSRQGEDRNLVERARSRSLILQAIHQQQNPFSPLDNMQETLG